MQCDEKVDRRREQLEEFFFELGHSVKRKGGRPLRAARREDHFYYWPAPLDAASAWAIFFAISAFTASRLKLAPFCIGGYSRKVWSSLPITCWTKTKRQNSYWNHVKYDWPPSFVPLSGQPVRSKGSRRRLTRIGTSQWVFSPSHPFGWSMKRYLKSSIRIAPTELSPR